MYHGPRGKGLFLPWLTFHIWARKRGFFVKDLFGKEKLYFRVMFDVSSPRRTSVRLGEGANLPREDSFFAKARDDSLGCGHVLLGEPEDKKMGPSSPPRRARLLLA